MERLVRLATVLHHAGPAGVPAETLVKVAGFEGGKDPGSQLNRELRHMREAGWSIDNIAPPGEDAHYRMSSVDNRLRVRLTPAQQAALRRAAILADRADLAERLGLPADAAPADLTTTLAAPDTDESLATVLAAVRNDCLLHFRYGGSTRAVHPESVRTRNGTWYLRGLEDGGDTVKNFVVSRMSSISADAPGTATRPPVGRHEGLDPMTWQVDDPVAVTLRVSGAYLPDVEQWLGEPTSSRTVAEGTTGDEVEMVLRVTNREALRARLHQLGRRVRLVAPDDVRRELLDELAVMAGED